MTPLTPRQTELLDFIVDYLGRRGAPPTYAEMQEHLGVAHRQSVVDLRRYLVQKGYLRAGDRQATRSTTVVAASNGWPVRVVNGGLWLAPPEAP